MTKGLAEETMLKYGQPISVGCFRTMMLNRLSNPVKWLALLTISSNVSSGGSKGVWPGVQALNKEWRITNVSSTQTDTPAIDYIHDLKGVPAYKLECHNGNYSGQSEMNFSGTFQCALFALENGRPASWNLLADRSEQDSDWGNRGRMLSEQLNGSCSGWAEYGARRVFRLRGMKITFRYRDLQWSKNQLTAFTFEVDVRPDPLAKTPEAKVVKVARPPRSCMW
jgi:hypothetical protein